MSDIYTVESRIAKQNDFFNSCHTLKISNRLNQLRHLKTVLDEREEDVYEALRKDLKKPSFEAFTGETLMVHKELKTMLKKLRSWSKPKRVEGSLLNFPSKDYIIPEPYGKVLIISPWNYPFQLAMIPIIGAVAAGNTVFLKPSESAPHTSKVVREIIEVAFPEEWVVVVEGDAAIASTLLKHKWDYIFYTGSARIGKIVAKAAAERLTPTTLELGGKSPCVVDGTTSIQKTARRIAWGKFINCGQSCIAPDYILVREKIKPDLIKAIIEEIRCAFGQNEEKSKDYGRIIHVAHFDKLIQLIENQKIIYGGQSDRDTLFIQPTLVDEPDLKSGLMQGEIFGPILPIISFKAEEDVFRIVRSLDKPLAFYVFSSNKTFVNKMLGYFSFGGGVVNDTMIHFVNDNLPFGGVGASGMGAYHGKYSFYTFSHVKSVVKRSFLFDLPQRFPPYPKSLRFFRAVLSKIL